MTTTHWSNGPGDRYPAHRHDYDKVLEALAGSIVFVLPDAGASLELRAGDRLDLPAGTLHAAEVGPAGVSCRESHLPRGSLSTVARHPAGAGSVETAGRQET